MKNKSLPLFIFAAATTLYACSNYDEANLSPDKPASVIGFYADIAPRQQSRADINVDFQNGLTGTWNGEDILGVIYQAPGGTFTTTPQQFTFNPGTGAFEGSLTGNKGDWQYRAFYPNNGATEVSGTTVTVPFSAVRTQKGNKYNSEYDLLAADAVACSNAEAGQTADGKTVKFNLHRFTSVLAVKLQGGSASEKIASVMLTAQKPIASEKLTFNIPTGDYDAAAIAPTLVAMGTSAMMQVPISIDSKHLTVTYTDGTAPSADYSETFFNILPDDSYGDLTFSVCTDQGNAAKFTVSRTTPLTANWVYTVDKTVSFAKAAAPTVDWIDHDPAQRYELAESGNLANIEVNVPGGIKSMQVDISSAPLATMLPAASLAESMDLTNPATEDMANSLAALGFPTPAQLLNQQHVFFQIGDLIDMLAAVCENVTETTNSDFKFTVTDNAGQKSTFTLQYVKTVMSSITYNNDADLWNNTATFKVDKQFASAQSVVVEYRIKGQSSWNNANVTVNADGSRTAKISPAWTEGKNDAGLTIYTVNSETGIFAKKTYEYQLTVDGTIIKSGEFTPDNNTGDTIENGDMEGWGTKAAPDNASKTIPYPNASGKTFWASGNNTYMAALTSGKAAKLCLQNKTKAGRGGNSCAEMSAQNVFSVFAAGNLFTGDFTMNGSVGYAQFGQKYIYSARPVALKLKYAATINPIDKVANSAPASKGDIDKARIFVCIIDWNVRHSVQSGTTINVDTFWDPATAYSQPEGDIIGYGSYFVTASTGDEMQELTIPINYYKKTDVAPTGNYTMIISCATSYLGDYLTGSYTNQLWVDDFEWVY